MTTVRISRHNERLADALQLQREKVWNNNNESDYDLLVSLVADAIAAFHDLPLASTNGMGRLVARPQAGAALWEDALNLHARRQR